MEWVPAPQAALGLQVYPGVARDSPERARSIRLKRLNTRAAPDAKKINVDRVHPSGEGRHPEKSSASFPLVFCHALKCSFQVHHVVEPAAGRGRS